MHSISYECLTDWYSKQTDFPDDTVNFAVTSNVNDEPSIMAENPVVVSLSRTPTTRSDPSEAETAASRMRQVSSYHVNATEDLYKDEPNILQVYAAYETGMMSIKTSP